jgi:hypothetical protein
MSELLKKAILNASSEDRLKIGLINCIDHLNTCEPSKILAVALTDSPNDMISQRILETYCYEQSIPFLKTEKKVLKRYIANNSNNNNRNESDRCGFDQNEPCCVLIMKPSFFNTQKYLDELELVNLIQTFEMSNDTLLVLDSIASTPTSQTNFVNSPFMSLNITPS